MRTRVNSRKSSGVRTKKRAAEGDDVGLRAVRQVELDRHAAALLRGVGDVGSPPPFEKRTVTGLARPACARPGQPAAVGRERARQQRALGVGRAMPGWVPAIASMASTTSSASELMHRPPKRRAPPRSARAASPVRRTGRPTADSAIVTSVTSLGQRSHDGLVEALAHRCLGAFHARRGQVGVRHQEEAPHDRRDLEVLGASRRPDALLGRVSAGAHVRRDRGRLRRRGRDQVEGVRVRPRSRRCRPAADPRGPPRRAARSPRRRRSAAEQVRHLAVAVPGRVVLEPPGVALEQQPRRARRSICAWIVWPSRGCSSPVRKVSLAVDHQPGADLEDVGASGRAAARPRSPARAGGRT